MSEVLANGKVQWEQVEKRRNRKNRNRKDGCSKDHKGTTALVIHSDKLKFDEIQSQLRHHVKTGDAG